METFDPRTVRWINTANYEAVPILRYLEELNKLLKVGPECAN